MIYKYQDLNWHTGHRFIGLILLVAGLISLGGNFLFQIEGNESRSFWIGTAFILAGIITTSGNTGIVLDLGKNQYRHYTKLLGIKWGEWEQLPQIDHVYTGSIVEDGVNITNGISPTLSTKTTAHFVLLMTGRSEALLVLKYSKTQKATDIAKLLSDGLKVPMKSEVHQ